MVRTVNHIRRISVAKLTHKSLHRNIGNHNFTKGMPPISGRYSGIVKC